MSRIPTHRPPTHPGELLLEEFLKLRLERFFGVEAQVWMNLQLVWDLYHAMHSASARNIHKIVPLK